MPAGTLVILNPMSRSGATGRRFAAVEAKLRAALGPLEIERTRGPRDAERIAREAVRAGVERLVIAGGDGTSYHFWDSAVDIGDALHSLGHPQFLVMGHSLGGGITSVVSAFFPE